MLVVFEEQIHKKVFKLFYITIYVIILSSSCWLKQTTVNHMIHKVDL